MDNIEKATSLMRELGQFTLAQLQAKLSISYKEAKEIVDRLLSEGKIELTDGINYKCVGYESEDSQSEDGFDFEVDVEDEDEDEEDIAVNKDFDDFLNKYFNELFDSFGGAPDDEDGEDSEDELDDEDDDDYYDPDELFDEFIERKSKRRQNEPDEDGKQDETEIHSEKIRKRLDMFRVNQTLPAPLRLIENENGDYVMRPFDSDKALAYVHCHPEVGRYLSDRGEALSSISDTFDISSEETKGLINGLLSDLRCYVLDGELVSTALTPDDALHVMVDFMVARKLLPCLKNLRKS